MPTLADHGQFHEFRILSQLDVSSGYATGLENMNYIVIFSPLLEPGVSGCALNILPEEPDSNLDRKSHSI